MPSMTSKQRRFLYAIESRPAAFVKWIAAQTEADAVQARRDALTIARMAERGWITVAVEQHRVGYAITPTGQAALVEQRANYRKYGPGRFRR